MRTPAALLAVALAATALTACDPQGSGDDALVGTWSRLRTGTTEMRDQWTFTADGIMKFDENKPDARDEEDHVTGPFTASGGVIDATVTNTNVPGREHVTFTYYAGSVFSSHAMRASGGHDGIVGVWTQMVKLEKLDDPTAPIQGGTAIREFRADGTFHWVTTQFNGNEGDTTDGTWVAESAGTFRATDLSGVPNVITLVDGEALIPENSSWQKN